MGALAPTVPAKLVQRGQATPAGISTMAGLQLLQVDAPICYPEIQAGDVLEIDFDRRQLGDGLYLLSMHEHGGASADWLGARRFARMPAGLQVQQGAEWISATPELMARVRVHGLVRRVFKPAG